MWRYRCKSHLISMLIGFAVGCVIAFISVNQHMDVYMSLYPSEVISYIQQNKLMFYAMSGLSIAGIVNIIRLMEFVGEKWNISPFIIIMLMIFVPEVFLYIGIALVIPVAIACIVGMIQLKFGKAGDFTSGVLTPDQELVRMYTLRHPLKMEVKELADMCRKTSQKIQLIYTLGLIAVVCVIFLVSNIWILIVGFLVFLFSFNILSRYRSSNIVPIVSLLYDQCDPEMCASAIIMYSTRGKKVHLQMHTILAQCLIYMDEPELAQDVLTRFPKKDKMSVIQYWTLMAYIYYLLKDEHSIERCKEELKKVTQRTTFSSVMATSEEMASIQNKIDLMNGELNTCRKYYLKRLQTARVACQQVDASYYIGLISFVEQDYPLADVYFKRVVAMGNKMSFVSKAQGYLDKLSQMNINPAEEQV